MGNATNIVLRRISHPTQSCRTLLLSSLHYNYYAKKRSRPSQLVPAPLQVARWKRYTYGLLKLNITQLHFDSEEFDDLEQSESNSGPSLEEYLHSQERRLKRQNATFFREDGAGNLTHTRLTSSPLGVTDFFPTPHQEIVDLTQEEIAQEVPGNGVVAVNQLATDNATQARFRLQAKNLFLTWPQCDTPKEDVLERIKSLPNYSHAVVCRENHKDELGVHLHAFVSLTKQNNAKGYRWLDDLAGKHGDYKSARNVFASVQYVIKDGDYVFDGFDPVAYVAARVNHKSTADSLGKQPSVSSQAAEMIRDGVDLFALDDALPGWVLMNKRKAQEYISFQNVKKARLGLKPWVPLDLDNYERDWEIEIVHWLNENIKKPRAFKQQQLYIYSDGPNTGKTTLVQQLAAYLNIFTLPKGKFIDGYISGAFDLVVCDEFKSHHTIQFLNEFLQGSQMHLDQKGSGTVKTDNPPMIFLSNLTLGECYKNKVLTGPFDALSVRFKQVCIPAGEKLDVFKTL